MARKSSFTTGRERSKLYTYVSYLDYFVKNRAVSKRIYAQAFLAVLRVAQQHCPTDVRSLRMLEIGSGQRFAATLLLHSLGAHVTGIDADYVDPHFTLNGYWRIWKLNGLERSVKTLTRHVLFDRDYYAGLAECFHSDFDRPLRWDGLDLRQMNACALDFPDNHFDFAFSRAVFEHIDNVPAACRELARVLKPGGVAFIEAHLFPSLSGGHNLAWVRPSAAAPTRVPPWDHLRQNRYPSPHYLNKLREQDYMNAFRAHFAILEVRYAYEGEQGQDLLTPALLAELPGYTRDELLKKTLSVVLQNASPGPSAPMRPPTPSLT